MKITTGFLDYKESKLLFPRKGQYDYNLREILGYFFEEENVTDFKDLIIFLISYKEYYGKRYVSLEKFLLLQGKKANYKEALIKWQMIKPKHCLMKPTLIGFINLTSDFMLENKHELKMKRLV